MGEGFLLHVNIYGWIFLISLGAFLIGWLGLQVMAMWSGTKMIAGRNENDPKYYWYLPLYRGWSRLPWMSANQPFEQETRERAKATRPGALFRFLFWAGLLIQIIFWAGVYFFAPEGFSLLDKK